MSMLPAFPAVARTSPLKRVRIQACPVEVHGPVIVRPFQGGCQGLRPTHCLNETSKCFLVSRVQSQAGSGSGPFLLVQTGCSVKYPDRKTAPAVSSCPRSRVSSVINSLRSTHSSPVRRHVEVSWLRGPGSPINMATNTPKSVSSAKQLTIQASSLRDWHPGIPEYLVQPAGASGLFQARDFGF